MGEKLWVTSNEMGELVQLCFDNFKEPAHFHQIKNCYIISYGFMVFKYGTYSATSETRIELYYILFNYIYLKDFLY